MRPLTIIQTAVLSITLFLSLNLFSQQPTFQVSGKNLLAPNGENFIIRGINYPILDHGDIDFTNHSQFEYYIDQAAMTGANAIRISWNTDGVHWRDNTATGGAPGTLNSYITNGHLDALLSYCESKHLVTILDIHDLTCSDDWAAFNSIVIPFWQSNAVQTLIANHQANLIINLSNETGIVRWGPGSQATALTNYTIIYIDAIQSLRSLGINVPIMIDAPDCGQSSSEMLSVSESINAADSLHNVIFSAHAYWGGYATTLSEIQTKLDEAQNTNVCFVLGEIANNQDNNTCGDLDLSAIYPLVLQEACTRNIGWLAWTYELDCSATRQMTTDGNFANLTAYGNDIVNNPNYGLKSIGNCGAFPVSISEEVKSKSSITISQNSTSGSFIIHSSEAAQRISALDVLGKELALISEGNNSYRLVNPQTGMYFIQIETTIGTSVSRKFIVN